MNRTGLFIALGIAAMVGIVFAVFPELDPAISRLFHMGRFGGWPALHTKLGVSFRNLAGWVVALVAAPAVLALVLKLLLPRRPMLIPARASILMLTTLVLGPGLITNIILKDNWSRPRPFHIVEFGGPDRFVPWWDPRGVCDTNCSFVAGEPAGAFWTVSAAAVTPPPLRIAAYAATLSFGAAVGLLRIAGGGHFFTDVVFAGVIVFLTIWLVHGLLYRWPSTKLSDAGIERLLERIAMPAHDGVIRAVARIRGVPPPR